MPQKELFRRNAAGRVVELRAFVNVFPDQENGFRIMFGGKVLEKMDELSGTLANMYLSDGGLTSVHAGEEVLFLEPIHRGESGLVIAKVVLVTEKFISVYVEVWGGKMSSPETFTLRYVGFGNCAVLDGSGAMVKSLEPYREDSPYAAMAEQVIAFQKGLRTEILKAQLAAGERQA